MTPIISSRNVKAWHSMSSSAGAQGVPCGKAGSTIFRSHLREPRRGRLNQPSSPAPLRGHATAGWASWATWRRCTATSVRPSAKRWRWPRRGSAEARARGPRPAEASATAPSSASELGRAGTPCVDPLGSGEDHRTRTRLPVAKCSHDDLVGFDSAAWRPVDLSACSGPSRPWRSGGRLRPAS